MQTSFPSFNNAAMPVFGKAPTASRFSGIQPQPADSVKFGNAEAPLGKDEQASLIAEFEAKKYDRETPRSRKAEMILELVRRGDNQTALLFFKELASTNYFRCYEDSHPASDMSVPRPDWELVEKAVPRALKAANAKESLGIGTEIASSMDYHMKSIGIPEDQRQRILDLGKQAMTTAIKKAKSEGDAPTIHSAAESYRITLKDDHAAEAAYRDFIKLAKGQIAKLEDYQRRDSYLIQNYGEACLHIAGYVQDRAATMSAVSRKKAAAEVLALVQEASKSKSDLGKTTLQKFRDAFTEQSIAQSLGGPEPDMVDGILADRVIRKEPSGML